MKHPKIISGECDGLGCGNKLCFCNEQEALANYFQEKYDLPWSRIQSAASPEQKIFEDAWYFGFNRASKLINK